MHGRRIWYAAGLGALIALGGCSAGGDPADPQGAETAAPSGHGSELSESELDAARARIVARVDSVREVLTGVRGLSRAERADLRRDVNARQVATARSLGVRARAESQIESLVREGRLVELEDTTEYWVVRELDYSVPYVTPDARAMLEEIGRRFHARLDSLGIPRFRMDITSVLRTPEKQAQLRGRNANAANGVSAHEFGTTVDVAHSRFAAPVELALASSTEPGDPMRLMEAGVLEEVARQHASGLQAELGRVLREMREEGKLRVMMERRQAVYHMTVARRFRGASAAE